MHSPRQHCLDYLLKPMHVLFSQRIDLHSRLCIWVHRFGVTHHDLHTGLSEYSSGDLQSESLQHSQRHSCHDLLDSVLFLHRQWIDLHTRLRIGIHGIWLTGYDLYSRILQCPGRDVFVQLYSLHSPQ